MFIQVCGAAREVTGSCYVVEVGDTRFLVDCGMHQGGDKEEALNFEPFPFDPREIDFVLLTHAHIDHSGRLPRLVQGRLRRTHLRHGGHLRPGGDHAARLGLHPGDGGGVAHAQGPPGRADGRWSRSTTRKTPARPSACSSRLHTGPQPSWLPG